MASRNRTERWMDDKQKALARSGQCVWQTGYGLPHTTYCGKNATHGPFCKEHWLDDLEARYSRASMVVFVGGKLGKVVRAKVMSDPVIDAKGDLVMAGQIRFNKEARSLNGKLLGKRVV